VGVHDLEQIERAGDVIAVVAQWLSHGFAHGLQRGEVDDGVDGRGGEDGIERRRVEQIDAVEGQRPPGQLHDPAQRLFTAVDQVIDDDHVVARAQ